MITSHTHTTQLLHDSIAMENAKTWDELNAICMGIEAKHRVEGIAEVDRKAYEMVKQEHARRVARAMVA